MSNLHVPQGGQIFAAESGLINDTRYLIADYRGGIDVALNIEYAEWYGQHLVRQDAEVINIDFPVTANEVAFKPATLAQLLGIDSIDYASRNDVSVIVLGATESTLTVKPDATAMYEDNEQVVVSDEVGYNLEGYVDGTPPSTTSVKVDDGAGAIVSGLDLVGVHAHINGTTQCFTRADNVLLDIASAEDYSIAIRFKRDSVTRMEVLMAKTANADGTAYGTTAGWCLFFDNNDILHFAVNDGVDAYIINGSTPINDGKYHAVVVTFDEDLEGGCLIYLDGYDNTKDYTGTLANIGDCSNAGVFSIGGEADAGLPFDGYIQDVAVYNAVVLTAANALTYATTPYTELGSPDAWWPFKDAAAITEIADEATAANSLDLTLVGGTTTNFGTHSRAQDAFISANLMGNDYDLENGGIGGWSPGDAASEIRKDTTYKKYGSQSLRIDNGDASQAYARQTVTTIANADYWFVGWHRSPETPSGASQLVDIDATAAKGATVTQAGQTTGSTWGKVQFAFEAGDTSATVDLGSGCAVSGEIGYWENVQLFKNYIDEGGFETNIAGSDWATTGTPTVDDADTGERSGTLCYKVNGSSSHYVSQTITLVVGEDYLFIGHVKCGTANTGLIVLAGAASVTLDNEANTTAYQECRYVFSAATTSLVVKIYGNSADAWFDDFAVIKPYQSVYPLDSMTEVPTLEWMLQYIDGDSKKVQLYYDSCKVSGVPITLTNRDYSTESITFTPIGDFVMLLEN